MKLPKLRQWLTTAALVLLSTVIGSAFHALEFTEANIITVYLLGVQLTALFARNLLCSGAASLASVLLFNFFFTEPRLSFRAYESGYPVTFAIMLIAALITVTLSDQAAAQVKKSAEAQAQAQNEQLRSTLLRSISHDLRTPLTSISGNAENLLLSGDTMSSQERRAILTDIHEDANWLIRLVENLLAITRIEDGRMRLNITTELVEEVITESLRHIRPKTHTILTRFEDDLLLAQMDARLISQVLINLVENAQKYTPAGSAITLSARRSGPDIAISVSDNGPGIPDGQKEKVFQMFYTGETRIADCRRSLGLGLALCRAILTAHEGTLTLTDNRPTGCTFTFTLPASEVTVNE